MPGDLPALDEKSLAMFPKQRREGSTALQSRVLALSSPFPAGFGTWRVRAIVCGMASPSAQDGTASTNGQRAQDVLVRCGEMVDAVGEASIYGPDCPVLCVSIERYRDRGSST